MACTAGERDLEGKEEQPNRESTHSFAFTSDTLGACY
jgi:hypothetical protein